MYDSEEASAFGHTTRLENAPQYLRLGVFPAFSVLHVRCRLDYDEVRRQVHAHREGRGADQHGQHALQEELLDRLPVAGIQPRVVEADAADDRLPQLRVCNAGEGVVEAMLLRPRELEARVLDELRSREARRAATVDENQRGLPLGVRSYQVRQLDWVVNTET